MNANPDSSQPFVAGRPNRVPSPLVGEGQCEGSLGLAEFADRRQHSVEIRPDLLVRNTPHAKAPGPQPRIAPCVIGVVQIVRLAVGLDDQVRLEADEIGDEGADRVLSPKLVSTGAPVTQLRPQQSFSPSRLLPQFARKLGRLHHATIACSIYRLCNFSESPLPLWERDRVRGLAPAGADESIATAPPDSFRAAARVPSPCPSPTRGEGTLQECLPSISSQESLP